MKTSGASVRNESMQPLCLESVNVHMCVSPWNVHFDFFLKFHLFMRMGVLSA